MRHPDDRSIVTVFTLVAAIAVVWFVLRARHPVVAQDRLPTARPFSVTARRYRFDPPRIEVNQDDLVSIELKAEDIAHSLTIDAYRISKRASPGHPLRFEFRADRPGTFPYYCNLQIDDGCRQMRGEIVVRPRR